MSDSEFGDEEALGGRRQRAQRPAPAGVRLGVAILVAALAAGGLLYATTRQSAARRPAPTTHRAPAIRSAAPSPTGTALAVVDNEVVAVNPTPEQTFDGDSVTYALQASVPTSHRNPDGTLTWSDELVNEYGVPLQVSGPIHVHVAPGLFARVLSVQLLENGVRMAPGDGIQKDGHLVLHVRLRVDCTQVDRAASRFPDVPVAVVIRIFGFLDVVTLVLGPTPSSSPWKQVCPG